MLRIVATRKVPIKKRLSEVVPGEMFRIGDIVYLCVEDRSLPESNNSIAAVNMSNNYQLIWLSKEETAVALDGELTWSLAQ